MPAITRFLFDALLVLNVTGACAHAGYPRPEDCSPAHGVGQVATPASPPIWRRGVAAADTTSIVLLTIYVFDAASRRPLYGASIDVTPSIGLRRDVQTDTVGIAHVHVPVGSTSIRARRVGLDTYTASVMVRPAVADTLRLGMGRAGYCAT